MTLRSIYFLYITALFACSGRADEPAPADTSEPDDRPHSISDHSYWPQQWDFNPSYAGIRARLYVQEDGRLGPFTEVAPDGTVTVQSSTVTLSLREQSGTESPEDSFCLVQYTLDRKAPTPDSEGPFATFFSLSRPPAEVYEAWSNHSGFDFQRDVPDAASYEPFWTDCTERRAMWPHGADSINLVYRT